MRVRVRVRGCASCTVGLPINCCVGGISYRYQHVVSFPQLFPQFGLPNVCQNRTCHATDVPFVFHNFANFTPNAAEFDLADVVGAYYVRL